MTWLAKQYGLFRWLISDHSIQTGYLWLPTFRIAMRTGRGEELLWRLMDIDLVALKDAVDTEISRRNDIRLRYGCDREVTTCT